MPSINDLSRASGHSLLARLVAVERQEVASLVASFTMFFALLAAYYVIRPWREEMGIAYGPGAQHELFTLVFVVMLAAVPFYGIVASRFPRRLVLPAFYLFFVICILAFWFVFRAFGTSRPVAAVFFVWGSVFNLFVVSLFWSLMAELWSTSEAKRLYGFISAGGTAGALTGPLIIKGLIQVLSPIDLLLVAAGLLAAALGASFVLRRTRKGHAGEERAPAGGGILDGAAEVFSNSYFARIALFVLIANIIGTFFYSEQQRLVAAAMADRQERLAFFASRDQITSFLTLLIELTGTSLILRRLGMRTALVMLPVIAVIGLTFLSASPVLWIAAAAMVGERAVAYALASPAIKVMYTTATPAEKYKVQSFIDTVVYRGGDAASGWIFTKAGDGLGFSSLNIPLIAFPLAGLWLWNAVRLAGNYEARIAGPAGEGRDGGLGERQASTSGKAPV